MDKSDRMVNSYGIARRTWKWTKKLFFHLTDMCILNAFLVHKTCGGKMTHKRFREILVRNLIAESQELNVSSGGVLRGRPSPSTSQLTRLEVKHSQHWPLKGKQRRCHVCAMKNKRGSTVFLCKVWYWTVHRGLFWTMAHVHECVSGCRAQPNFNILWHTCSV